MTRAFNLNVGALKRSSKSSSRSRDRLVSCRSWYCYYRRQRSDTNRRSSVHYLLPRRLLLLLRVQLWLQLQPRLSLRLFLPRHALWMLPPLQCCQEVVLRLHCIKVHPGVCERSLPCHNENRLGLIHS